MSRFFLFSVLTGCATSGLATERLTAFDDDFGESFRSDVVGLAAPTGDWLDFSFDVPAGTPALRVLMLGGSGDADLYLRHGSAPDAVDWDCRPFQEGNAEECTFDLPKAGTWHIGVHAYVAFTDVELDWQLVPVAIGDDLTESVVIADQTLNPYSQPCVSYALSTPHGVIDIDAPGFFNGSDPDGIEIKARMVGNVYDWCTPESSDWRSCTVKSPPAGEWTACFTGLETEHELEIVWTPATLQVDTYLDPAGGSEVSEYQVLVPEGALTMLADFETPEGSPTLEITRSGVVFCSDSADAFYDTPGELRCEKRNPPPGVYTVRLTGGHGGGPLKASVSN